MQVVVVGIVVAVELHFGVCMPMFVGELLGSDMLAVDGFVRPTPLRH